MAQSGPNNGATFVSDATLGTVDWTNPSNAQTQNNSYATVDITSTSTAKYLKATDFGFALDAADTINGITVEVDRYATSGIITDGQIRIVKAGGIGTTDKSDGGNWATSDTDAYITYGGATDLWGETWTASDINDSTFGFAMRPITSSFTNLTANVDHIRITIDFTDEAGNAGSTMAFFGIG